MIDTIIYYILPNVILFGSIYLFCKGMERYVEDVINFVADRTDLTE